MATAAFFLFAAAFQFFSGLQALYEVSWSSSSRLPALLLVAHSVFLLTTAAMLPHLRVGWWMAFVQAILWTSLNGFVVAVVLVMSFADLMVPADIFWSFAFLFVGAFTIWACLTYGLRGPSASGDDPPGPVPSPGPSSQPL